MRMIKPLSISVFVIVSFLVGKTLVGGVHLDPYDDYSFTLHSYPKTKNHRVLSEKKVTKIFEERLRGFSKKEAPHLAKHLIELSRQYRFDPAFLLALIHVESSFHVRATSSVGAKGLMQLMPGTAKEVARSVKLHFADETQLYNPYINLSLGVAYLSILREQFEGIPPYYLAAYNAGPYKVKKMIEKNRFYPVQTRIFHTRIRASITYFRNYFYQTTDQNG